MFGRFSSFGGILVVGAVTRFADCPGSGVEAQPLPTLGRSSDAGVSQAELDEAAVAACGWLWANVPEAKTWEYCGVLYQDNEVSGIRVGLPQRGRHAWSCMPDDPSGNATVLGRYHNHRFDAVPSWRDNRLARAEPLLSHYLCGPSGIVRRISPTEGTVNIR